MHVVVDRGQGRLVRIEVTELGSNAPPVEQRLISLFDREQAELEPAPHGTDVDARTVEVLVVPEERISAAHHRRPCYEVESHERIGLPAQQATVESAEHTSGIARLTAEPPHHIPL